MPKMSPSEFAEKWARNLKGATSDIIRGIDRVTEAPGEKAARKKDKWVARMTDPTVQARWAQNVAGVSLEEWREAARTLIPQRLGGGVDRAIDGMADFAAALLAYQERALGEIARMPDVTLEDAKQRMLKWFDMMSKFKYK